MNSAMDFMLRDMKEVILAFGVLGGITLVYGGRTFFAEMWSWISSIFRTKNR